MTSMPFSLDSLSLVRSVIFQSPSRTSLINDGCLRGLISRFLYRNWDQSSLNHLTHIGAYTHNRWEPVPRPRGLASTRYCCWHRGNHHGFMVRLGMPPHRTSVIFDRYDGVIESLSACVEQEMIQRHTAFMYQFNSIQFNSIQLLYSRLNSIICIQVVHNNLRSIYVD